MPCLVSMSTEKFRHFWDTCKNPSSTATPVACIDIVVSCHLKGALCDPNTWFLSGSKSSTTATCTERASWAGHCQEAGNVQSMQHCLVGAVQLCWCQASMMQLFWGFTATETYASHSITWWLWSHMIACTTHVVARCPSVTHSQLLTITGLQDVACNPMHLLMSWAWSVYRFDCIRFVSHWALLASWRLISSQTNKMATVSNFA